MVKKSLTSEQLKELYDLVSKRRYGKKYLSLTNRQASIVRKKLYNVLVV